MLHQNNACSHCAVADDGGGGVVVAAVAAVAVVNLTCLRHVHDSGACGRRRDATHDGRHPRVVTVVSALPRSRAISRRSVSIVDER